MGELAQLYQVGGSPAVHAMTCSCQMVSLWSAGIGKHERGKSKAVHATCDMHIIEVCADSCLVLLTEKGPG
jgi:hypothetical protein